MVSWGNYRLILLMVFLKTNIHQTFSVEQRKKSCFHIINHYFLGKDAELFNISLKSYWIWNFNHYFFTHNIEELLSLGSLINLIYLFKELQPQKMRTPSKITFLYGNSHYKVIFHLKVLKLQEINENLLDQHGKMHSRIFACSYRRLS